MLDQRAWAGDRMARRVVDAAWQEHFPNTLRVAQFLSEVVPRLAQVVYLDLEPQRALSFAQSMVWLLDRTLRRLDESAPPGHDTDPLDAAIRDAAPAVAAATAGELAELHVWALGMRGRCRCACDDVAGGEADLIASRRAALERGMSAHAAIMIFDLARTASSAGRHAEAARRLIIALEECYESFTPESYATVVQTASEQVVIGRIDEDLRSELEAALAQARSRAAGQRGPSSGPAEEWSAAGAAASEADAPTPGGVWQENAAGWETLDHGGLQRDYNRQLREGTDMIMHGRHREARDVFGAIVDGAQRRPTPDETLRYALRGLAISTAASGDVDAGASIASRAESIARDPRNNRLSPAADTGIAALALLSGLRPGTDPAAARFLRAWGLDLAVPAMLATVAPGQLVADNALLRAAWNGGVAAGNTQLALGGALVAADPSLHLELLLTLRAGLALDLTPAGLVLQPPPLIRMPDGVVALKAQHEAARERYGLEVAKVPTVDTVTPTDTQRPTLLLTSHDPDHLHLSTVWLDVSGDRPANHQVREELTALRHLVAALPGAEESAPTAHLASGPFARDPQAVVEMLRQLGSRLVGRALFGEIRQRAEQSGSRVHLRVQPATSLAHVPWPLLVVGDECLADYCDVTIDIPAAVVAGRARVAQHASGPAVRLIDPDLDEPGVLPPAALDAWRAAVSGPDGTGDPGACVRARTGRQWLSQALRASPARLFYVGHVRRVGPSPTVPALALPDPAGTASATPQQGRWTYLSAMDLICGTALGPVRAGTCAVPGLPVPDAGPQVPCSGPELWPMPERVAFFACQSGAELAHHDPAGLVTAAALAGARLITATAWPLLTDAFFAEQGCAGSPVADLALDLDACHGAGDPVAALGDLTRRYLARWRADPCLETSPITWGALQTYLAPGAEAVTR